MHTANHPTTNQTGPDSRLPTTAACRGVAVITACLLTFLCVLCARWGYADIVATIAMSQQSAILEKAARTGEAVAPQDANEVIVSLLLAQGIDSGNPATAEQLGGAYTIDVQDTSQPKSKRLLSRQWAKAFEQYSRAVALRPTSPYACAGSLYISDRWEGSF